ncbi:hypothetical protein SmJEL517_g05739 [Synchytrium microbalum]|uniref:TIR domain-containing protein n=1 Tax=Synchytrium microbalum TaxID=1806994 RepID=A0A507BTW5_9FUNG|nr:uncharacterized protein SmJEL517_g05739 [Synchytrium microbalum]TPX30758.1 hypothetical protein SmJEL517_g05739 [Synchytrium microbalum]
MSLKSIGDKLPIPILLVIIVCTLLFLISFDLESSPTGIQVAQLTELTIITTDNTVASASQTMLKPPITCQSSKTKQSFTLANVPRQITLNGTTNIFTITISSPNQTAEIIDMVDFPLFVLRLVSPVSLLTLPSLGDTLADVSIAGRVKFVGWNISSYLYQPIWEATFHGAVLAPAEYGLFVQWAAPATISNSGVQEQRLPSCGLDSLSSAITQGKWNRNQWMPASCRLERYSPTQACQELNARNMSKIGIVGDSLSRHFFNSLVQFMTGKSQSDEDTFDALIAGATDPEIQEKCRGEDTMGQACRSCRAVRRPVPHDDLPKRIPTDVQVVNWDDTLKSRKLTPIGIVFLFCQQDTGMIQQIVQRLKTSKLLDANLAVEDRDKVYVQLGSADIVLPCLSPSFEDDFHSMQLLDFCSDRHKNLVPIRLSNKPLARTALNVAGLLYEDFSKSDVLDSDKAFNALAKQIVMVYNLASSREDSPDSDRKYDIMISYCWAQQPYMYKLLELLRGLGYTVWVDVEKMVGNVFERMQGAVQKSKVIVSCLSQAYAKSVNCQRELCYSVDLKKPIIPIRLEADYLPIVDLIVAGLPAAIPEKTLAGVEYDDIFIHDLQALIERQLHPSGNALNLKRQSEPVMKRIQQMNESMIEVKSVLHPNETYKQTIGALQLHRLPNTRDSVIREIRQWMLDDAGEQCYWLNGVAGSGKSIVAAAIVKELEDARIPVVPFFCKFDQAGQDEVRSLIRTMAFGLARALPEYCLLLHQLFATSKTFGDGYTAETLFEQLILNPLNDIHQPTDRMVILIDALDEVGQTEEGGSNGSLDRQSLLGLFANPTRMARLPSWVKFIITSRPEDDIAQSLTRSFATKRIDLDAKYNQDDIRFYITTRMDRSRPLLPSAEWEDVINMLVIKSTGLFLWATIVCEILRRCSTELYLQRLLTDIDSGNAIRGETAMDDMFARVLHLAIADEDKEWIEDWLASYKAVVGVIICLKSSLSVHAVASLVYKNPEEVRRIIARMPSVFESCIQDDGTRMVETIRIIHKSVADYLTDKNRCRDLRFYIDTREAEGVLSSHCLQILTRELKFSATTSLPDKVAALMGKVIGSTSYLDYICKFWMDHLSSENVASSTPNSHTVNRFLNAHGTAALLATLESRKSHACRILLSARSPQSAKLLVKEAEDSHYFPVPFLCQAVRSNDADTCEVLLSLGVSDINSTSASDYGWTPLAAACAYHRPKVVAVLLKHNPDYQIKDFMNKNALERAGGECWNMLNDWKVEKEFKMDLGPVLLAAQAGDITTLKAVGIQAVSEAVDIGSGRTALHVAADNSQIDVVNWLLDSGALTDTKDQLGCTSLYLAARKGLVEIVKALKDHGADLDQANNLNQTPLFAAAFKGHIKAVEYLISMNADVNIVAADGRDALFVAAQNGHFNVLQALSSGSDTQIDKTAIGPPSGLAGQTPLWAAASNGYLENVKYLVDEGADVNAQQASGQSVLFAAVNNGSLDIISYLVEKGSLINVGNDEGVTPLLRAAANGRLDIVKYLSSKGGDVHKADNYPNNAMFAAAGVTGYLPLVQYLVNQGVAINVVNHDHKTPVWEACYYGRLDVVKCLIEAGGDSAIPTSDGITPLVCAALNGHLPVVQYLAKLGMDIETPSDSGISALIFAAAKGYIETVKYLVENGAAMNRKTLDGRCALFVSSNNGHMRVISYLVQKGCDLNIAANDGRTPLFVAAQSGRLEVVKLLIQKGADVNTEANGTTLLDIATLQGHTEVASYLRAITASEV